MTFEAFLDDLDPDFSELEHSVFEPNRSVLATQGDTIAGMVSAFTRDLTVPGGVVPGAHVTMVSVGATHRRQGLLRSEEHTSELQSRPHLVCRLLLEKKKINEKIRVEDSKKQKQSKDDT